MTGNLDDASGGPPRSPPPPPPLDQAYGALPREAVPPPDHEDRTVAALRRSGLLAPGRARGSRLAPGMRAAAAVVLFLLGAALGRTTAPGAPDSASPAGPRFMLLLYGGELPAGATDAEHQARFAEYAAWAGQEHPDGAVVGGEELAPESVALGPAPAAGDPGGYFMVVAADMDSALRLARTCPHLQHGGTVVVRRVAG